MKPVFTFPRTIGIKFKPDMNARRRETAKERRQRLSLQALRSMDFMQDDRFRTKEPSWIRKQK